MSKKQISDAQKAAHKRHEEKRKALPILPSSRLSASDGEVMDKLYEGFESKTEAIVKAAEFYLKNHK